MKITDRLVTYAAESRKEAAATEAAASYLVTNPVSIAAPMVADVLILGAHEMAAGLYQESIRTSAVRMRDRAARLVELANAAEKLASSPKAALALIGLAAISGDIDDKILADSFDSVPTCTTQQSTGLKRRGLVRMSGYTTKYSRAAVRPNDDGWMLIRAMVPGLRNEQT